LLEGGAVVAALPSKLLKGGAVVAALPSKLLKGGAVVAALPSRLLKGGAGGLPSIPVIFAGRIIGHFGGGRTGLPFS
jgi:hypothetical protein